MTATGGAERGASVIGVDLGGGRSMPLDLLLPGFRPAGIVAAELGDDAALIRAAALARESGEGGSAVARHGGLGSTG